MCWAVRTYYCGRVHWWFLGSWPQRRASNTVSTPRPARHVIKAIIAKVGCHIHNLAGTQEKDKQNYRYYWCGLVMQPKTWWGGMVTNHNWLRNQVFSSSSSSYPVQDMLTISMSNSSKVVATTQWASWGQGATDTRGSQWWVSDRQEQHKAMQKQHARTTPDSWSYKHFRTDTRCSTVATLRAPDSVTTKGKSQRLPPTMAGT